jgi:putative addiction module component (TIGR02574 family)
MADAAEDLFDEAMKLPDSERRILALWLLDSAGEEAPEDVERAWLEEARRRLEAVRGGRGQPVPWDEARQRIFARRPGSWRGRGRR